jgi:DNA-binding transcriptional ArsR family regulator
MTEDIDEVRKELEEVRKMKERLRDEIETLREERHEIRKRQKEIEKDRVIRRGRRRLARPPEPPEPPEAVRVPRIELNLEDMTDSLEEMMDRLGEQIEESLKGLRGIEASIRLPGVYTRHGKSKKRKIDRDIENISPERVAEVISPLSSVERLRILEFLRTDAATFNEIEQHIGKTGSSLTHHLNPLIDAGYVLKGEVRGTYHATVQGILAYRLAKWLTSQVEKEQIKAKKKRKEPRVVMDFEDEDEESVGDDTDL